MSRSFEEWALLWLCLIAIGSCIGHGHTVKVNIDECEIMKE